MNINYLCISKFSDRNYIYVKKLIKNQHINVNKILTLKALNYRLRSPRYVEMPGVTMLYAAVTNNDQELIDYLLKNKANVNIPVGNNTSNCLHKAIVDRNLDVIRKLIAHGADLEQSIEPYNDKPLDTAIETTDYEIIKILVESGANVKKAFRKSTRTNSVWTVYNNFSEIVELLWKYGADFLHYKTPLGFYSAMLSEAVWTINEEPLKALFALGANLDCGYISRSQRKTYPILYRSVEWYHLESLVPLLEYENFEPEYINALTEEHGTLLHVGICAEMLHYEFFDLHKDNANHVICHLLSAGIDVNVVNNDGKLAIDCIDDDNSNLILHIKEHIVKLIAVGRYVCQRNIDAVLGKEFNHFRSQCQQEVKKMEATMIGNSNLSYDRLLRQSIHESAKYLKHVDLSGIVEENFSKTLEKTSSKIFPLYGGLIYYRLIKVPKRVELLKKARKIIDDIFYKILPDTCCQLIYHYLTNNDLKKLCEQ